MRRCLDYTNSRELGVRSRRGIDHAGHVDVYECIGFTPTPISTYNLLLRGVPLAYPDEAVTSLTSLSLAGPCYVYPNHYINAAKTDEA